MAARSILRNDVCSQTIDYIHIIKGRPNKILLIAHFAIKYISPGLGKAVSIADISTVEGRKYRQELFNIVNNVPDLINIKRRSRQNMNKANNDWKRMIADFQLPKDTPGFQKALLYYSLITGLGEAVISEKSLKWA